MDGLPPAVALQQQRGSPTTRSSVGSVTTLTNLLRMLYSRAGDYPRSQPLLYAESFSPNMPEGACPNCHGIGRLHDVSERSMVADDELTIRDRAVAAWPTAWQGQNLRDILVTLGYDVDKPWRELPKKDRDWILFTDDQPTVPVYAGYTTAETKRALKRKEEPSYQGTFIGARKYVLQTFATTQSAMMKRRVAQFLSTTDCPVCHGKRLKPEALSVTFAGMDIAEISRQPVKRLGELLKSYVNGKKNVSTGHPEKQLVIQRIMEDLLGRLEVLLDLGLGYLTPERSTPTLSPGELQRLRLATQVRSNLFGVVYVLDEPSAGLHPADTEALLRALDRLKAAGNSLFVVEHELDIVRHADWIVDVGPGAGEQGGKILYSGPISGLADVSQSQTRRFLFAHGGGAAKAPRNPGAWLKLRRVTRNNLVRLDIDIPLGVFTSVTGISGSGKSSLISQFLVETVGDMLGHCIDSGAEEAVWIGQWRRSAAKSSEAWTESSDWSSWIKSRSAGRRGRTSQRIPVSSITCANSLRPQSRLAPGGTIRVVFRSMLRRAGARPVREKGPSPLSCFFCPASTLPVQPARARVIMPRPWKSRSEIGRLPTSSG